jgi:hypothetical protein
MNLRGYSGLLISGKLREHRQGDYLSRYAQANWKITRSVVQRVVGFLQVQRNRVVYSRADAGFA